MELRLLEPLLAEHGLDATQWQRQYPLRMGRGERIYPDYIVGLTGTRGEESAHAILEAKLTIGNHKQLHEAFLQARSYAERLRAEVVALVAVQGVWVITVASSSSGLTQPRT